MLRALFCSMVLLVSGCQTCQEHQSACAAVTIVAGAALGLAIAGSRHSTCQRGVVVVP